MAWTFTKRRSRSQKIVGQGDAIRAVVDLYQVHRADLCPASRPIGNLLLLGLTGSGKTRIVEAAAEILFGDAGAVIKVDCGKFQHSHEITKLIGSPPGYLGHRETSEGGALTGTTRGSSQSNWRRVVERRPQRQCLDCWSNAPWIASPAKFRIKRSAAYPPVLLLHRSPFGASHGAAPLSAHIAKPFVFNISYFM